MLKEIELALIKSLITRDRKVARGACYLSETRNGQKCELIIVTDAHVLVDCNELISKDKFTRLYKK